MSHATHIYDRIGDCYWCSKRSYASRAAARRAIKRLHPGEHKQAYRCPVDDAQWHIGKLDERVARGDIAKEDRYREAA